MINAYVVGDAELVRKLESSPQAVRANLTKAIARLAIALQREVKQGRLSGQVLHVRTGTLRRSINQRVDAGGEKIAAKVGTPVWYGKVHEFGGQFQVKEHVRLAKQAFGRELRFPVWQTVRQHTTTVKERSFLRSALADMRAQIEADMESAVRVGVRDTLRSTLL